MEYFIESIKGKNRNINKDSTQIVNLDSGILFVIFDGVSSAKGAVEIVSLIKSQIFGNLNIDITEQTISTILNQVNECALNSKIEEPFTTISLLFVSKDNKYFAANVGDSPIYLLTRQSVIELSTHNKSKQYLENYIGNPTGISYNISIGEIVRGDFIMCTDGFDEIFNKRKSEIFDIIMNFKRSSTLNKKISDIVSREGNSDDSTIIFIRKK